MKLKMQNLNMKKNICIILAIICVCFSLTSCNQKNKIEDKEKTSGITISAVGQKLFEKEFSSEEITESENGLQFRHSENYSYKNITYCGEADKNKNVSTISIIIDGVDISILTNSSKLTNLLTKATQSPLDCTSKEMRIVKCVMTLWDLQVLIDPSSRSQTVSSSISQTVALFNGKAISSRNWEIKASNISDTSVKIIANFNASN